MNPGQEELFGAKNSQHSIVCNGDEFLYQLWLIKKDDRRALTVECGNRNSEYTIEYSEPGHRG